MFTEEINCVIVKDLSRFGRNYLDTGNYLERVFPEKGVRLIAIHDDYDSEGPYNYSDALLIPFKNLINDNYCAATSAKTRASLDVRRRRGEYVGSFVSYGYLKDPRDKSKLIVDEEAAETVRWVFDWILEGLSPQKICDKLNELGIPSPEKLREIRGQYRMQPLRKEEGYKWHARAIYRMIKDEIYIGNMVQGKSFKPSFRSKVVAARPEEDWVRVEGTHEPIIDRRTFDLVQSVMSRDTRSSMKTGRLSPLSGLVFCAECGDTMSKHNVKSRGRVYSYYCCTAHLRNKHVCYRHSIREEDLLEAVKESVMALLAGFGDVRANYNPELLKQKSQARRHALEGQIERLEAERQRNEALLERLEDDLKSGFITEQDLQDFSASFKRQVIECTEAIANVHAELATMGDHYDAEYWISAVEQWSREAEITRPMLVELIDRVEVSKDKEVTIKYRFSDCMAEALGGK